MRIAVAGSWKKENSDEWQLENEEEFPGACRSVGAAVTSRGHVLIAGGVSRRTADYNAVEGVIDAHKYAPPQHPPVMILRPDDTSVPYPEWQRAHPNLFASDYAPGDNWNIAKLFQVNVADAIIVIGGADYSFQAGIAAAVCGKVVIPIGSFGGAGRRLLRLFQASGNAWGPHVPTREQLGQLNGPWTSELLDYVLQLLRVSAAPKLMIVHGRSNDRYRLKNFLQNQISRSTGRDAVAMPEPIIMGEQSLPGGTLPEKFERLAANVDGAIAVVTPDDVGRLADAKEDSELELRARQNVWLEVGWFWGHFGRDRFLLLVQSGTAVPSDLSGVEYCSYTSDPAECSEAIRAFVAYLAGLVGTRRRL